MLGYWEPEAFSREAEAKRQALRAEFQRGRALSGAVRRGLSRAAAGAARALWGLSEWLGKGAEGGRGLEGAPNA